LYFKKRQIKKQRKHVGKVEKSPITSIQIKTMREGNLFEKAKLNDFSPLIFPPYLVRICDEYANLLTRNFFEYKLGLN
jgi:hypothetical protein